MSVYHKNTTFVNNSEKTLTNKMKIIPRLLSLAALLVMLATSCDTKTDQPTITEQAFPGFFANVHEYTTGAMAVYSNLSYKVTLNYTDQVADVQISGLKLPDGTTYPTMTLRNLRWGIDNNGWREITGREVQPEIGGFANPPVFTQFKFRIYERFLSSDLDRVVYSPAVCANYVINGVYGVMSSYSPQVLYGTTVSTDTDTNIEFESNNTIYTATYNTDTRTLTLRMNGIRFNSGINDGFDMELRNIPLEMNNNVLAFKVAYITPYLNGTVFDSYPISDLKGEFNPGEGLKFSFATTPRNSTTTYRVNVECDFARTSAY